MKNYLVNKILEKYEGSQVDWNHRQSGGRSIKIQQSDYDELQSYINEDDYLGFGLEDAYWEEKLDGEAMAMIFTNMNPMP